MAADGAGRVVADTLSNLGPGRGGVHNRKLGLHLCKLEVGKLGRSYDATDGHMNDFITQIVCSPTAAAAKTAKKFMRSTNTPRFNMHTAPKPNRSIVHAYGKHVRLCMCV